MKPAEILQFVQGGQPGIAGRHSLMVTPRNARFLGEGSHFSLEKYQPDDTKAYVEFEICHSLPFVAGPAQVGGYSGFHPAALARSHKSLRHQQTNLHHLIKKYDPQNIPKDCIIGAVVDTYYPPRPEGGWKIPQSPEDAIPITVLAVVFKQAENAMEMLKAHVEQREEWSVSIECTVNSFEDLGIWVQNKKELVPILEADDELLALVNRNSDGRLELGKDSSGLPLAMAYGALSGRIVFQGVGYTPTPAEAAAEILAIRMSQGCEEFDFDYAAAIQKNWPSIWAADRVLPQAKCAKGGREMHASEAFATWSAKRGGEVGEKVDRWATARLSLNREAKILAQVVRLMKWGLVSTAGIASMKAQIDTAKAQIRSGRMG